MSVLDEHIDKIRELCNKYSVVNLFVFGSAVTDQFNAKSDIDFIVNFSNLDIANYADNYFQLKYSLEELLKRNVDLLEDNAITNPYLRESIGKTKKIVYGY